ncbi:MAG TPA: enoyl-CoA hydratase/isomerase family protein [Beijerinckiaceae bacterium]|jgi:enoyl-CoA hydratase|nr:enoyl-CoA hydratase/isomerase family protein [Beijerinckiaceae bacterium]
MNAREPDAGTTPVLAIEGPRATIRLNRPRQLNKITPEDIAALLEQLDEVGRDDAVRVLILTGTGRAFSGGYDLGDIAARQKQSALPTPSRSSFEELANRIEDFPVPTICRLNGGVYGGSTDLALACDFRIGVNTCEMLMPAARVGLHYYPSGIRRYVSRLGVAAAKKLFLTAQKIDVAEMLRIGYLDVIVPVDELDPSIDALAAVLAANAPKVMRGMKAAINEIARAAFDEDAARRRHQESLRGDEIKEGIAAFGEKRPPDFGRR